MLKLETVGGKYRRGRRSKKDAIVAATVNVLDEVLGY